MKPGTVVPHLFKQQKVITFFSHFGVLLLLYPTPKNVQMKTEEMVGTSAWQARLNIRIFFWSSRVSKVSTQASILVPLTSTLFEWASDPPSEELSRAFVATKMANTAMGMMIPWRSHKSMSLMTGNENTQVWPVTQVYPFLSWQPLHWMKNRPANFFWQSALDSMVEIRSIFYIWT